MEHVLPDERRVGPFSRVTPPSWRAVHVPNWNYGKIPRRIVPMLLHGGAAPEDVERMLVADLAPLLVPA